MANVNLRFTGATLGVRYSGLDGNTHILVKKDDICEVSDAKAKQLMEDFPKDFSEVKKDDAEKQSKEKREAELKAQKEADATSQKSKGKK